MSPSDPRFAFGSNWQRFAALIDDERIGQAKASLRELLQLDGDLAGKRFLDIGCGSGLFSLAAHRLGADVTSFDYDPDSVACTERVRDKHGGDDVSRWRVERGDALDRAYIEGLGRFDVVYAWGVLHHTGDMWRALEHTRLPLEGGGLLFVALYNDQGWISRMWTGVKKAYNAGPLGRAAVLGVFVPYFTVESALGDLSRLRWPTASFREYKKKNRGMTKVVDWIDWVGGYPFEVATTDEVVAFFKARGCAPTKVVPIGRGHGCNQFVFRSDA